MTGRLPGRASRSSPADAPRWTRPSERLLRSSGTKRTCISETRPSLRPAATSGRRRCATKTPRSRLRAPAPAASRRARPSRAGRRRPTPDGSTVKTYFWYSSTPTARSAAAPAWQSARSRFAARTGSRACAALNSGIASLAMNTRMPSTATTTRDAAERDHDDGGAIDAAQTADPLGRGGHLRANGRRRTCAVRYDPTSATLASSAWAMLGGERHVAVLDDRLLAFLAVHQLHEFRGQRIDRPARCLVDVDVEEAPERILAARSRPRSCRSRTGPCRFPRAAPP